jgi:hypothetical protein
VVVQQLDNFSKPAANLLGAQQQEQSHAAVAQHAQQMTMLYEASLEVNAITDVTALLHLVVERTSKLIGAQAGAIYLATQATSRPAPGSTIASLGATRNRLVSASLIKASALPTHHACMFAVKNSGRTALHCKTNSGVQ